MFESDKRHQPTLRGGLIVSGDRFITSAAKSQALREALTEAVAVAMESADDEAHVDFEAFMRDVAHPCREHLMRKALDLL